MAGSKTSICQKVSFLYLYRISTFCSICIAPCAIKKFIFWVSTIRFTFNTISFLVFNTGASTIFILYEEKNSYSYEHESLTIDIKMSGFLRQHPMFYHTWPEATQLPIIKFLFIACDCFLLHFQIVA